jgi:hypothetical protein
MELTISAQRIINASAVAATMCKSSETAVQLSTHFTHCGCSKLKKKKELYVNLVSDLRSQQLKRLSKQSYYKAAPHCFERPLKQQ